MFTLLVMHCTCIQHACDVVEAHATALNQTGTLVSNHLARGMNCSEMFRPRGSESVTKRFVTDYLIYTYMLVCRLIYAHMWVGVST